MIVIFWKKLLWYFDEFHRWKHISQFTVLTSMVCSNPVSLKKATSNHYLSIMSLKMLNDIVGVI